MEHKILSIVFATITLTYAASSATADIKIKSKTTTGAQSILTTTLMKGQRTRSSVGFGLDTIDQCDLNRAVLVNDKGKRYMLKERPGQNSAAAKPQNFGPDVPSGFKPEKTPKRE